jgi:C-terminal processing protease CtpA/Prc
VLSGADGVQAGDSLLAVDDIPTAGSTLGQVWAMLGGEVGQRRRLTLERGGKRFVLLAKVQHFLGRGDSQSEGKSGKKR